MKPTPSPDRLEDLETIDESGGVGSGSVEDDGNPNRGGRAPIITRTGAARLLAVTALTALVAATAWLPWEWSLIDDGSLIGLSEWKAGEHGVIGGMLPAAEHLYRADRAWGLFRPAFWIAVMPFYQLPAGAAHAVRVGQLLIVLLGAISIVTRGTTGRVRVALAVWTGLVVMAIGALFPGIWFPSLQELSGLCFVGLGLLAWRRPWLVAACWLVAAWFKAPFAWLLLAYGVLFLIRRGTRIVGAVSALAGVGTLVAAFAFSRNGWYTQRFSITRFDDMDERVMEAARAVLRPGAVLVLGALLLLPRPNLRFDPRAPQWVLLAGGFGYLFNLIPWHTGGYYAGPFVFLLAVGALLVLRDIRPVSSTRLACALVVPLLVAGHGFSRTFAHGWDTHETVTGLRDCLIDLPDDSAIGFNRPEGWIRLHEIVRMRAPGWTGKVVYVPDGATTGQVFEVVGIPVQYYIHEPTYGPGTPALMAGGAVCRTPYATVYKT